MMGKLRHSVGKQLGHGHTVAALEIVPRCTDCSTHWLILPI